MVGRPATVIVTDARLPSDIEADDVVIFMEVQSLDQHLGFLCVESLQGIAVAAD